MDEMTRCANIDAAYYRLEQANKEIYAALARIDELNATADDSRVQAIRHWQDEFMQERHIHDWLLAWSEELNEPEPETPSKE